MDEVERCTRLAYIAYSRILTQGTAHSIIEDSHLSTWKVFGKNLVELAAKLKTLARLDLVAAFGSTLHVSAANAN